MEMFFFFKKYPSIFMLLISFLVPGTLCGKDIVPELSSNPQQIGKFSLRDASQGLPGVKPPCREPGRKGLRDTGADNLGPGQW